jgi:hypothetical protein
MKALGIATTIFEVMVLVSFAIGQTLLQRRSLIVTLGLKKN